MHPVEAIRSVASDISSPAVLNTENFNGVVAPLFPSGSNTPQLAAVIL